MDSRKLVIAANYCMNQSIFERAKEFYEQAANEKNGKHLLDLEIFIYSDMVLNKII